MVVKILLSRRNDIITNSSIDYNDAIITERNSKFVSRVIFDEAEALKF